MLVEDVLSYFAAAYKILRGSSSCLLLPTPKPSKSYRFEPTLAARATPILSSKLLLLPRLQSVGLFALSTRIGLGTANPLEGYLELCGAFRRFITWKYVSKLLLFSVITKVSRILMVVGDSGRLKAYLVMVRGAGCF